MTCTKLCLSFQNTLDNLHNVVVSLWASFRYVQRYHNANGSDVGSYPTRSDGTKGQPKEKGKGTARAKMPKSVINRCVSLDRDCIQGFISEHIRGLIRIYNVCGIKDERDWDLFYNIIFLDPVTTRHFSQFQLMWPQCRSRNSPLQEWWAAFRSYMGQMFYKTHHQMNDWR